LHGDAFINRPLQHDKQINRLYGSPVVFVLVQTPHFSLRVGSCMPKYTPDSRSGGRKKMFKGPFFSKTRGISGSFLPVPAAEKCMILEEFSLGLV
jgi:hypothetical protein